MAIISIGNIDKKLLYAVIGGVFKALANILLFHIEMQINYHPCIYGINNSLGLFLSFFPFIYMYKKRKKKLNNNQNNNKDQEEELIYNDPELAHETKSFYVVLVAVLDLIQKFFSCFFAKLFLENFWLFDSLFLLLFSYYILKEKAYIHHFFSLIGMIIIGIILTSINYYDSEVKFLEVFATLSIEIIYSLENVVCKYVMNTKYYTPYLICVSIGTLELIIFIILLIIFTNVPISGIEYMRHLDNSYIDNFYKYMEKITFREMILFIFLMFCRLLFFLFGLLLINAFTPLYLTLILIISEISFLFVEEYNWKIYLRGFFFIILIFLILIFTEIIELNVCGLQINTKKNIILRSNFEGEDIKEEYNKCVSINEDIISEEDRISMKVLSEI